MADKQILINDEMLRNKGIMTDSTEYIIQADSVLKINKRGKKQERIIVITNKHLYNLENPKTLEVNRKIAIENIELLTTSRLNDEFVIHIPTEQDYHFTATNKSKLIAGLKRSVMEHTGKNLKLVAVDDSNLVEQVTTKDMRTKGQKAKKSPNFVVDENKITDDTLQTSSKSEPLIKSKFETKISPVKLETNLEYTSLKSNFISENFKKSSSKEKRDNSALFRHTTMIIPSKKLLDYSGQKCSQFVIEIMIMAIILTISQYTKDINNIYGEKYNKGEQMSQQKYQQIMQQPQWLQCIISPWLMVITMMILNVLIDLIETKNKAEQTFDGIYFGSIENLASSSQIQNYKNAVQQNDTKELNRLNENLQKESPQLQEFVTNNSSVFINYFKVGNNALSTLNKKPMNQQESSAQLLTNPSIYRWLQNFWILIQIICSFLVTFEDIFILLQSNFDIWTKQNLIGVILMNNSCLKYGWAVQMSSYILAGIFGSHENTNDKFIPRRQKQIVIVPTKLGHFKWFPITVSIHAMTISLISIIPFVITHLIPSLLTFLPISIPLGACIQLLYQLSENQQQSNQNKKYKYGYVGRNCLVLLIYCMLYWGAVQLVNQQVLLQHSLQWPDCIFQTWTDRNIQDYIKYVQNDEQRWYHYLQHFQNNGLT